METTWITLLNEIMQTVVVPLMGILTVFLIKVIREKMDAAAKNTKNETLAKYILMLKETVVDCVEATNQTFVDARLRQAANSLQRRKKPPLRKLCTL